MKQLIKILSLVLILTIAGSTLSLAAPPKGKKRKATKMSVRYSSKYKKHKINDCSKMGQRNKEKVAVLSGS